MNVKQAAVKFGKSVSTIYRWIKTGIIQAAKVGRSWIVMERHSDASLAAFAATVVAPAVTTLEDVVAALAAQRKILDECSPMARMSDEQAARNWAASDVVEVVSNRYYDDCARLGVQAVEWTTITRM